MSMCRRGAVIPPRSDIFPQFAFAEFLKSWRFAELHPFTSVAVEAEPSPKATCAHLPSSRCVNAVRGQQVFVDRTPRTLQLASRHLARTMP